MPYGRMSLGAKLPMDVIPASSVMGDDWHGVQGHGVPQDKVFESSLECEVRKHGLYRENVYQLGDGLVITHLNSNNVINSASDELFCRLQMDDLGLESLPMKRSQCQISLPLGTLGPSSWAPYLCPWPTLSTFETTTSRLILMPLPLTFAFATHI